MLPDIKYSLPVIFVLWCAMAWLVFGGPVMLAYPAMWLAVGVVFWAMDRALRGSRATAGISTARQDGG